MFILGIDKNSYLFPLVTNFQLPDAGYMPVKTNLEIFSQVFPCSKPPESAFATLTLFNMVISSNVNLIIGHQS